MTDINNKTDHKRDLSAEDTGPISTQEAKARRGHWRLRLYGSQYRAKTER